MNPSHIRKIKLAEMTTSRFVLADFDGSKNKYISTVTLRNYI